MRSSPRTARTRHRRYRVVQLVVLVGVGAVLFRAFQIQVLHGEEWRTTSIRQHETRVLLPAPRGTIYDREGRRLVVSRTTYRVSVAPQELTDRRAAARAIGSVLSVDPRFTRRIADGERRWVVLPGTHSVVEKQAIEDRVGGGLYFEPVVERFYPRGELARELIGRVDAAGRGLSGLELTLDSVLAGHPGFGLRRRDATGASAGWLVTPVVEPTPGMDIRLSLDAELQALAESVLEDAIRTADAAGGDLLIVEPKSGDLLAAASRRAGRADHLAAVTEPYEPGSTLKPFAAAALLAEGRAELTDTVYAERGTYRTAGRTIHDEHDFEWLTLAQVLERSSNVGIAKFSERLSRGTQYSYLRDFGFGTPTGLPYPSESAGRLRAPDQWSGQSQASLAIGYEIAVTPLQLAMAYGAIANGGVLMRPRLVSEARDAAGTVRWRRRPEPIRQVIPEPVAADLREVLARAVTQGTGRSAGVHGLRVAGKTGTAQRFDPRSGYAGREYTASFVGLIPSDVPELVIMVKLDKPSGAYYGAQAAAPVMRTTVRAALAGSHWPVPPLLGEPDFPDNKAGVSAGRVPVSGPFIFALDAPLRRTGGEPSRGMDLRAAVVVPDVRDLPLRAAVQTVHEAGLRVVVQGGGRVVSMEPMPGANVQRGERVVLVGADGPRGSPGRKGETGMG